MLTSEPSIMGFMAVPAPGDVRFPIPMSVDKTHTMAARHRRRPDAHGFHRQFFRLLPDDLENMQIFSFALDRHLVKVPGL